MSNNLAIDALTRIIGDTQLPYTNMQASQFMKGLAPKPDSANHKVNIPSYFRELFNSGFSLNISCPSGPDFSFWHCILNCVLPECYGESSWHHKKLLVNKLIEQIEDNCVTNFPADSVIIRNTTLDPSEENFRQKKVSAAVRYLVSSCLRINIIILDRHGYEYVFPDLVYSTDLPTIILHRDSQSWYTVLYINEECLFDHSSIIQEKLPKPEFNVFLRAVARQRRNMTKADKAFYCELTGQTVAQHDHKSALKNLSKLKLTELKALADMNDIDISVIEGRLTKAKIIELLNEI